MLAIYVLSHNRPNFILECVRSVEVASFGFSEVEFFVSDNSSTDDVHTILKESSISVTVLRRKRYMTGIEHINYCLKEARLKKYTHVCLFHDDDVMMPGFVEKTLQAYQSTPSIAAAGFNITGRKKGNQIKIYSKLDLIKSLFSIGRSEIIPFPSFTYNLDVIESSNLDERVGKHCDVEFLLRVANCGGVAIVKSPEIKTRVHPESDSYVESICDRRKLLNAVIKQHQVKKRFFRAFRVAYILRKKKFNRFNLHVLKSRRFLPIFCAHLSNYLGSILMNMR